MHECQSPCCLPCACQHRTPCLPRGRLCRSGSSNCITLTDFASMQPCMIGSACLSLNQGRTDVDARLDMLPPETLQVGGGQRRQAGQLPHSTRPPCLAAFFLASYTHLPPPLIQAAPLPAARDGSLAVQWAPLAWAHLHFYRVTAQPQVGCMTLGAQHLLGTPQSPDCSTAPALPLLRQQVAPRRSLPPLDPGLPIDGSPTCDGIAVVPNAAALQVCI